MTKIKKSTVIATTLLGLCLYASTTLALEVAKEDIILEVSGNISVTNTQQGTAVFDRKTLSSLPVTEIQTETPWTNGTLHFEGVLLRDLMEYLKATGNTLQATAINDYAIDIPIEDFQEHDVIIAYKMNGKVMSIRDKGPLWIIYPWSDTPSLRSELYHSRSIWQLIKISIK